MKKILIVDNDSSNLSLLAEGLKRYDAFEVVTTESAKLAAKLLNILKIDLVITELNMPEIDGFKLLAYIKKKYPGISIIVMTSNSTLHIQEKAYALGVIGYFEKPVNIDMLSEILFDVLHIVPEGRIQGISLASFLQLVDMEGKTCTLTVKSKENMGHIYCVNGDLIGANAGDLKGKDALYKILRWDKATIEIEDICHENNKEIDLPLMHLLMESQTTKDEKEFEQREQMSNNQEIIEIETHNSFKKKKNLLNLSTNVPDINEDLFDMKIDELIVEDFNHEERVQQIVHSTEIKGNAIDAAPKVSPKITEILKKTPGVYEFEIFDQNDRLIDKTSEFGLIPKLSLSNYLSMGNKLKELFHIGSLNYMEFHTTHGMRYCLFKYDQYLIIVALETGLRAADFFKKMPKFKTV